MDPSSSALRMFGLGRCVAEKDSSQEAPKVAVRLITVADKKIPQADG